jgi:hypothetical protein
MNTGYLAKGALCGKLPGLLSADSPGMVIQKRGVLLLVSSFGSNANPAGSLIPAGGEDER